MKIEKIPLQIDIIWHFEFEKGKKIAEDLFKLLDRDPDEINQHEIGIPVKFNQRLEKIKSNYSEKTGIIILIDQNFACDDEYQKKLEKFLLENGKDSFLIPISFISNMGVIEIEPLKKVNVFNIQNYFLEELCEKIKVTSNNEKEEVKEILLYNNILEKILKELYGKDKKIRLFLSHTKRDDFGKENSKLLKDLIQVYHKVDVFYDINDIEVGNEIWGNIEKEFQKEESFLVVINTNEYSNSSWCRKEVLCAKKYRRPIMEINLLYGKQQRSFPYLGNMKRIILGKDFKKLDLYKTITEIYLKALRVKYKELLMKKFEEKGQVLLSSPEILDFALNPDMKNTIYYPDPILPKEEKELFEIFGKKLETPLEVICNEKILKNKNAMFSISETSEEYSFQIKSFISEIVRYLIAFDLNILYGGSLKYNDNPLNLLRQMLKVIEFYKKLEEIDAGKKIRNYLAYPLSEFSKNEEVDYKNNINFKKFNPLNYPSNNAIEYLNSSIEGSDEVWSRSLTIMREKIIKDSDYIIVAGGKLEGFKGKIPGVLEEVCLGIEEKKPIYIIGYYEGVSKEIIKLLLGEKENNKLEKYGEKIAKFHDGVKILNNGLSEEENKILFELENNTQIIELILKGMSNIK